LKGSVSANQTKEEKKENDAWKSQYLVFVKNGLKVNKFQFPYFFKQQFLLRMIMLAEHLQGKPIKLQKFIYWFKYDPTSNSLPRRHDKLNAVFLAILLKVNQR
jgi:hypothetical protein